jgi:hypothetical protein
MRRPIVVLTVAALASACAGHTTHQADEATTSTTRATTTTTPDPKTAVLAAYQRFWQVWLEANNPPNPNDPRLAEVDTGAQLSLDRAAIRKNLADGIAFRKASPSRADHRIAMISLSANRALLQDCSLDDGIVIDRSSGSVVNADVLTYLWKVTLVKKGGQWKVEDNTKVRKWPGANDCGWGPSDSHSP